MAEHSYGDIRIEAPESGALVRKRLHMFFAVGPEDPPLGANVLSVLGEGPLHAANAEVPAHIGPDVTLPTEFDSLDLHGPLCSAPPGLGSLLIRDHRRGPAVREVRYH
ncbi:hypothetical protein ACIG0C_31595 [Kitasatospora aureofaciens]|uniref:Uncharacterized protein n=1 Tax=Kitasatospora aureofaciens TaxID=1894 RepID=A0A1E7N9C2_KITAU|nr:hypothetical protein [Kitasatospora aureofaciens]ARF81656.1 hypothetical protein B6264_24590 [Kitasatospora aureofaciens]OEV37073.1 hypothetical protein HS99_0004405 [Kitasatospora aureofaciens]GGV01339.1 hypothetical protein GCM10010502_64890 [Kitasatospora aureofaciens]